MKEMIFSVGSMNSIFLIAFLAVPTFLASASSMLAQSLKLESFGHSSILIKGEDKSILLNPFKAVGCASGLVEPKI